MQLYSRLPAIDYDWTTTSIDSLKRLRGANQPVLNQMVVARAELVRLAVFTAVEFTVHVALAVLKFTAIVIAPRVAVIDAGAHAARSAKLAAALFVAPVVGLARPEWSISLYQKLSLVKQSDGHFASLRRLGADLLAGSALLATGVAIRSRFFATQPQSWFPIPLWAGLAGAGAMVVAFVCVVRHAKIRRIPQLSESVPQLSVSSRMRAQNDFKRYGPVHKMAYDRFDCMWALQGSTDRKLRTWDKDDHVVGKEVDAADFVLNNGEVLHSKSPTTFRTTLSDGTIAYGAPDGHVRIMRSDRGFHDLPAIEGQKSSAMARADWFDAVATTDGQNSTLRVIGDRHEIARIEVMGSRISVLEIYGTGADIATIALNGPDGAVGLWRNLPGDAGKALSLLQHATTHGTIVTAIYWLTDTLLITGDNKGTLRVWDTVNGKLLGARTDHQELIYNIQFKDDCIYTYSHDGQIRYWAPGDFPNSN